MPAIAASRQMLRKPQPLSEAHYNVASESEEENTRAQSVSAVVGLSSVPRSITDAISKGPRAKPEKAFPASVVQSWLDG